MASSTSLSLSFIAWVLLIAPTSGPKHDDDSFPSEEKRDVRNMEFSVPENTETIDEVVDDEQHDQEAPPAREEGGLDAPATILSQDSMYRRGHRLHLMPEAEDSAEAQRQRQRQRQTATTFILDSGASMHATGNLALLSRFVQLQDSAPAVFHTRDGRVLRVAGTGAISFGDYHIPNVSYIPQLGIRTALVSVQQLAGCGYFTLVSSGCCLLRHQGDGSLVGRARLHQDDGLYHLQYLTIIDDIPPPAASQ